MITGAELSSLCGYSLPAQFKFVPKSTRGLIFVLEIGVEVKKRVLLTILGLKKTESVMPAWGFLEEEVLGGELSASRWRMGPTSFLGWMAWSGLQSRAGGM